MPDTAPPFHRDELESSVPARFRRVAAANPQQLAVVTPEANLTYAQLDAISDQIGQRLLRRLGPGHAMVGLLLGQEAAMHCAILGVLKAGKGYLALHPDHPTARLAEMLSLAGADLVLSLERYRLQALALSDAAHAQPAFVDAQLTHPGKSDNAPLPWPEIKPEDVAVLFTTSGTTGKPKGVPRSQRHLLHNAWEQLNGDPPETGVFPSDRHSQLAHASFTHSVVGIFTALLSGATLVPLDPAHLTPHELAAEIQRQQVTILQIGVPLFRQLALALDGPQALPQVRLVILGGQALRASDLETFRRCFGSQVRLINRLGMSEVGLVARKTFPPSYQPDGETLPVGRPGPDKELLILDEQQQPLPMGEIGEIAVRSGFIFEEYWPREAGLPRPRQDELGRRLFLTGDLGRLRPDGDLEHLGRKDDRVRIRGYSVALGAVETAVNQLEAVAQAVVVNLPASDGENRLVAYYVLKPGLTPDAAKQAAAFRQDLAVSLPDYMLPQRFVCLPALPLTASGKVSRKELPPPGNERPALAAAYLEPRSDLERYLCEIWQQVLNVHPVGIHDPFFELGGHSLAAGRIVSQVQERYQVALTLQDFFNLGVPQASTLTVARLSELVLLHSMQALSPEELATLLAEIQGGTDRDLRED